MENKEFEDLLKDKLFDYQYDDIPDWNDIEKKLYVPKNRTFFPYVKYIAAVMLLLLIPSVYIYMENVFTEDHDQYTYNNTENEILSQNDNNDILKHSALNESENIIDADKINISKVIFSEEKSNKPISDLITELTEDNIDIPTKKSESIEKNVADDLNSEEEKSFNKEYNLNFENKKTNTVYQNRNYIKKNSKNNAFNLGLLASNIPTSKNQSLSGPARGLLYNIVDYKVLKTSAHFGDKQLDPMEGAEFKHDMPFSVGALIDFEIYNNFFIESGLTFSILKSTFSNSMHNLTEGKQKANFIGIPLAVNYNFFNYKSLSIYAGLGAKIDINLKLSQKYYLNSQLAEFDKRYKKPIYSGRVKVGITYKIIDKLYLFAEPSIAKYNKSSNINTAWTAKKFNPELQFGLKTAF